MASPPSADCVSECSAIINLAAVHRDDVKPLTRYHEVNVEGARNVCEIATKGGVRTIIFTGVFSGLRLICASFVDAKIPQRTRRLQSMRNYDL